MPELPEVETIRRGLLERLPGRRFVEVEQVEPFMLPEGAEPGLLREALPGRLVEDVRRHGKFLTLVLSDDAYLMLHLGMTGQVTLTSSDADLPKHGRFAFLLEGEQPRRLLFRDMRKFGGVELTFGRPTRRLEGLGPDALEGEWTHADLVRMLAGRTTPLKAFLLDQRRLAGIGNIYADEILWAARLSPLRPAGALSEDEVVRLATEIRGRLAEGVRLRGCSISDFVDAEGRPGGFQRTLQAYGRQGEPCARCGRLLDRTVVAGPEFRSRAAPPRPR